MASFEKKEKNFVVIICNYSVCKVKGNESEMVHCCSWVMDYFNFSFSAFREGVKILVSMESKSF